MTRGRGARRLWVVGLLLVVVNFPVAHGSWVDWRLDSDGLDTVATVTDTGEVGGDGGLVEFRYDETLDPDQQLWSAGLDEAAYRAAVDTGTVRVRVDPDDPARYRVEGEQSAGLLLVLTLFADVVLLLAGGLMLRRREDADGVLHLVALEDVVRARPAAGPPGVEELDPHTYRVVGEVSELDDDGLLLDAGGRRVRVDLDGHANPVGRQQPARVTGRLKDSTS